ncbi:tetratricopeptide repeat protein [Pseudomonas sp. NMS19W]|uniref:tetratricopeptide repeat protein n=1 Tax=Pseudomonas sp. NMS19W TaxID=3079768 RepID=UPI003F657BEA
MIKNKHYKSITQAFFVFLAFASHSAMALTSDQAIAKEKGITLFNQYKSAETELRIAAEAGDAEAQFYLAEEIRQRSQYITPEAKKWLEAASAQGDLYAMLRLARSDNDLCTTMKNCPPGQKTSAEWMNIVKDLATSKAQKGDAESAYVMYLATGQLDWLKKSAESGFAQGQWLLAIRYKEGNGSFFVALETVGSCRELGKGVCCRRQSQRNDGVRCHSFRER